MTPEQLLQDLPAYVRVAFTVSALVVFSLGVLAGRAVVA